MEVQADLLAGDQCKGRRFTANENGVQVLAWVGSTGGARCGGHGDAGSDSVEQLERVESLVLDISPALVGFPDIPRARQLGC